MRADNHGEGGILALLALVSPRRSAQLVARAAMVVDDPAQSASPCCMATARSRAAISVLSCNPGVEELCARWAAPWSPPRRSRSSSSCFLIQRNGTSFIGGAFRPVMLVWFASRRRPWALRESSGAPAISHGAQPLPAVTYLQHARPLASGRDQQHFLAVTGGEAFYADMGHTLGEFDPHCGSASRCPRLAGPNAGNLYLGAWPAGVILAHALIFRSSISSLGTTPAQSPQHSASQGILLGHMRKASPS